MFSVERTENNKKQALWVFVVKKYRVAIDFFLLPSSQRQKKSIFTLRPLRLCGEKENEIKLHNSTHLETLKLSADGFSNVLLLLSEIFKKHAYLNMRNREQFVCQLNQIPAIANNKRYIKHYRN